MGFSVALKVRNLVSQNVMLVDPPGLPRLRVIAVCAGLLIASGAHAAQCPLVPDDKASVAGYQRGQLLRNGQLVQLETELEKLHKKNLASDGGDLLTLRLLVELIQMSAREENLVRMWVDQRPQSFFALLTAGIFYSDQASAVRGNRSANEVSRNQKASMLKYNEVSLGHLQKAMAVLPRSALPQAVLIGIAGRQGEAGGKTAEQWLQTANQIDSKNLAARVTALNYLSPRWGGSFALLDQMVQQAEKSLSTPTAHYLQYNLVLEKASHKEVIENNKSQAYALYKQAQTMCENSSTARDGAIRTYP